MKVPPRISPLQKEQLKPGKRNLYAAHPMTNEGKVYEFLKAKRSKAYCNNCLAKETSLAANEVAEIAVALRRLPQEFTRWHGACCVCNNSKHVVIMAI